MAKKSFIVKNVTPLSQNNRSSARINSLGNAIIAAHNLKYPKDPWPRTITNYELNDLEAKVFYLHKVNDFKDADNISKPLWDSLNAKYYKDDKQIKYLETLKVSTKNTNNWLEFDLTDADDSDFIDLVDFLLGINKDERVLYIALDDFKAKNVRF